MRHGLLHGVSGAELLGLKHPFDLRVREGSAYLLCAVAVHHDDPVRRHRARRGEHVRKQRPACERMQDLGQLRTHALALARGEYDDF
jgi:hypothetical protein